MNYWLILLRISCQTNIKLYIICNWQTDTIRLTFCHIVLNAFLLPSAEVIVVVVYNIIYIIQAKTRAFMGHIGAYIPHLWRCYPPWPSPRGLFLIYGPTDGRDDFPIKIQPLKIHFYFLAKIQNKNTISKNFFRKKFKIKKYTLIKILEARTG